MVFDRTVPGGRSAEKVIGVGHKVFDKALRMAAEYPVSVAWSKDMQHSLVVFQVYDRITDQSGRMRQAVVGIQCADSERLEDWSTLRDWEVLEQLNSAIPKEKTPDEPAVERAAIQRLIEKANERVVKDVPSFDFPFKIPEVKLLALIWAGA